MCRYSLLQAGLSQASGHLGYVEFYCVGLGRASSNQACAKNGVRLTGLGFRVRVLLSDCSICVVCFLRWMHLNITVTEALA